MKNEKNKNEKEDVTYYGITILALVALFGFLSVTGFNKNEIIIIVGAIGIIALIIDTIDYLAI